MHFISTVNEDITILLRSPYKLQALLGYFLSSQLLSCSAPAKTIFSAEIVKVSVAPGRAAIVWSGRLSKRFNFS